MIRSLWHTVSVTEIRSLEQSDTSKNKKVILSKYSMISLGTESIVMNKKVPKSVQNDMKAPYMEGGFELPIKYGYALSGVLENGDKVHVMHPHQNKCWVDEAAIFSNCQELPLKRIPLISNMETVINAIWNSDVDAHKTIMVCGFGNIGSLLAMTLKCYYNLEVKILETDEWRKQKAQQLGFEICATNERFDVAFNTTANEKALQYCIDHANEEAKIIELSWYGTSKTTLNLGANFHKNRVQIISSQVSKIPIKKRKEYDYYKRKLLAVEILKNNLFDELITTVIPFDEAPLFFNDLRQHKQPNGLIYLIKY